MLRRRQNRSDAMRKRCYWVPGAYAPLLSEKRNSFLKLLKNKAFKEERRTKNEVTPPANSRPWNPTRASTIGAPADVAPAQSRYPSLTSASASAPCLQRSSAIAWCRDSRGGRRHDPGRLFARSG